MAIHTCPNCGASYDIGLNKCPYCGFYYHKMKVNPNPMCESCIHQDLYIIDADCIEYNTPIGMHFMCVTPEELFELEGYTQLGQYYDKYCIDGFQQMSGLCEFYKPKEVL